MTAVRRPGVHVNRSLTTEKCQKLVKIRTVSIHQIQTDMHVWQMFVGFKVILTECEHQYLLSVGGNVSKPVILFGEGHLRRLAAVAFHPPQLHQTATGAIEPDVSSVRAEFRAVIETNAVSQADFLTSIRRNNVYIDVPFGARLRRWSECTIAQFLTIWTPTVQITRCVWRYKRYTAAIQTYFVDQRAVIIIGLMADSNEGSIRTQYMIVITMIAFTGV